MEKYYRTIALQSLKRYFIILLLGILILCLSSVSAYYCYQETANVSTICGGNNSGNYGYAKSSGGASYNSIFYVNYSKPVYATNLSNWSVSFMTTSQFNINRTIPASCFNYAKISIRVNQTVIDYGGGIIGYYTNFGCYNGTQYLNLTAEYLLISSAGINSTESPLALYDGNWSSKALASLGNGWYSNPPSSWPGIYEEAMYWDMPEKSIQNVNYSQSTYELSTERFNITYISGSDVISTTDTIYYNGTAYSSTTSCNGLLCTASASINIPTITLAQENKSFYWNITFYNATGTSSIVSSVYNQSISQLSLTPCSTGNIALNFSAYDEQNRTRLTPFDFQASFEYSVSANSIKRNLSISNSSATEVLLCINRNVTLYLDSIIAYSKTGYPIRNYFTQSYQIRNISEKIPLYLLTSGSSTSFILQVQDRNLQPVKQVLVNTQKCYTGLNSNETVFIHRTDSSGLTVGNFEAETALYQFFITNQSQTLLSVTPCAKVVPQTTPYTLLFQLGSGYVSPFTNIENLSDITSTIYFNNSNGLLTWTYTDTSGIFNYSSMIVSNLNWTGTNSEVCSQTNSISSGVITCNITNAGTYSAKVYVYRTNQVLVDQHVFTYNTRSSETGLYGVFLAFILIIISAFAFKFNEVAGIALINIVVIFCNVVGLVNFGAVFITAMVAISIIIIGVLDR